ncbi:unnamed protein product [Spirodela intermedia]|uniref:Ribosomal protein S7 n=1 Tax=Spirodela intermedia TaxID=51605 RepID=A0ABN7ECE5_SPIIN|nr:unnamed protein product [Spirodela intermedia]
MPKTKKAKEEEEEEALPTSDVVYVYVL